MQSYAAYWQRPIRFKDGCFWLMLADHLENAEASCTIARVIKA